MVGFTVGGEYESLVGTETKYPFGYLFVVVVVVVVVVVELLLFQMKIVVGQADLLEKLFVNL